MRAITKQDIMDLLIKDNKEVRAMIREEILKITEPEGDATTLQYKVKSILKEEYGISEEVTENALSIKDKIENDIRKTKPIGTTVDRNSIYYGKFIHQCFGRQITILYNVIDYDCDENYINTDTSKFTCDFRPSTKEISLIIPTINRVMTVDGVAMIQHELHHYYEYKQRKGSNFSPKYTELYAKIRQHGGYAVNMNNLTDKEKNDIKMLNTCLYYCFDTEVSALLNEFDVYVRNNGGAISSSDYEKLKLIRVMSYINTMLLKWNGYHHLIRQCYGIQERSVKNMLNNALKRYGRGIIRILRKYEQDRLNETASFSYKPLWFEPWRFRINEIDMKIRKKLLNR